MATTFGYIAAIDFFERKGDYQGMLKTGEEFEHWTNGSYSIIEYYHKLRKLYNSSLSNEEKLQEKEKILQEAKSEECMELNNAVIWGNLPYAKHVSTVLKVSNKHPDVKELADILVNAPVSEKEALKYLKDY